MGWMGWDWSSQVIGESGANNLQQMTTTKMIVKKMMITLTMIIMAVMDKDGNIAKGTTDPSRGGRWTSLDASFARCFAIF